ncbi:MAG: class I SAM-dependent methyltransferase, partial [Endomicrobiales bacterium]
RTGKTAARSVGIEVESRLAEHFKKNRLKVFRDIQQLRTTFDVITLFHVLEHFADPVCLLKKLAKKIGRQGEIIVEVPNADDALLTLYKCDPFTRFTYWSCHLYLFTEKTLAMVADKAGLKINYIKQYQRYPLSNHLYWLSHGKPGGHKKWHFLDSKTLHDAYQKSLAAQGCCDTLIGSFSVK